MSVQLDVDRALDLMRQPGLFEGLFDPLSIGGGWRIAADQMVGLAVFRVERRFWCAALAHSLAALWHGLRIAYARCARLVVQRSGDAEPERRELGTLAFLFCAFVRGKN